MTVSSTTTKNSYSGDGSNTVFAYTFKVFDEDDLTVILRTDATGTETVQTITTNYTVSGVGDAGGGNVTFVTAPASGITVVVKRAAPLTQTTDYTPNDPFPAEEHENALDKLTFIAQQQQEEIQRTIKLSPTNTMTSTEFTVGATARANKILGFDGSGELSVTQELGVFRGDWTTGTAFAVRDLIKDTTNDNIYICQTAHTSSGSLPISTNTDASAWELIVDAATATTSATSAAASATAAASSATAASASETAAAASESAAATSESNAAASETAAAASESAAATSESNAATSETNAATSATSAASSATSAASSATTATTKAAEASTSASNAATSETNAATSAASASSSATASASSATAAASSATSAASSATSAASAQTAAEAARDAIQQFYLGAQTSNPTVDGNGDPVTAGDWYFNTTDNTTRIYDGSSWNTVSPDLVGDITPQLGGNLDTNGNDINFGDNDKAVFGASSDLQIYHDGSNSWLRDTGTGNLYIQGSSAIHLRGENSEFLASFGENSATTLYYDSAAKLATTSSGIDVTGTVTADDLTLEGNSSAGFVENTLIADYHTGQAQNNSEIQFTTGAYQNSGEIKIRTAFGATMYDRIRVGQLGDISFYDNTGVTQGFYWDASTQNLGLGTTSPSYGITLEGTGAKSSIRVGDTTNSVNVDVRANSTGGLVRTASNHPLVFATNQTERMRIDSSGNLLVGKTSSTTSTEGVELKPDASTGYALAATGTSQRVALFNRLTSDGEIVSFRKDGSSVGSIGNTGTILKINGSSSGIYVGGSGAAIWPQSDNTHDLGTSGLRFQDAHFGGTVNVGTAVAATQSASVTGSTTLDFSTYQNFILTMTGNITLANPTTEQAGQSGFIILIHSGAARTVSLGTDYETAGAAGLTLSGASGAVDLVPYVVQSSGNILLGAPQLAFA